MLAVVGLKDERLEEIVKNVKSEGKKDEVLEIANYLFPQGRVALATTALASEKKAQDEGALKVAYLAVSGAFHTSRMDPPPKISKTFWRRLRFRNQDSHFHERSGHSSRVIGHEQGIHRSHAHETTRLAGFVGSDVEELSKRGQNEVVRARTKLANQVHDQTRIFRRLERVYEHRCRQINGGEGFFLFECG